MVIYRSHRPNIPIPKIDLFSYLTNTNEYNQTRDINKPIAVEGESGKTLSWKQIREKARYLATGWNENVGLKKGDVVAVFAPNQFDHVVLYLSLLAAKCTISPGNPAYTEAEFKHQITNCQATALVTVPALLPMLLKITDSIRLPRSRVFLFGDKEVEGCRPFNAISGKKPVSLPLQDIDGYNDTAFICYSSGTTGLAKGVMLTHKNFIAQIIQALAAEAEEEEKHDDDVVLGFLPFYHIYGLTSLILNSYYKVTPVIIMSRYDLELFCQLIQKYKVTLAAIVPPVAVQLAKSPIVTKYDLTTIRLLGCGAAPLSKEHITALKKRVPADIRQGYGMTETTSGVISQNQKGGVPGSIGVLSTNMEMKIVNEKGEELGDDQEGEFFFRGPSIMKGYYNNEKANAETFMADGWMRTGDVGKFDSKTGEFFILDRIKELIKYKGYQVAPAELEAILMGLEIVADCCVVGWYDDNQATELPRAYIVLQPSVSKDEHTVKQIDEHVSKNVTNYKKLRGGIKFVDAIPKSPSGKILRRQVKDWVKKEQAAFTKARL
ncbi:hypothetical protein BDF20DRAFT_846126 [Mycotypha africana]|uniref:uncharacterized protein n=1 Tax=Mycotypha africana TaxID=64632 RepID=UPI0023017C4B|nr:uncharacterized protein BDF20DRAFT_846126 [Mycotypha africana]KAI8991727.1 hypothetical protein BDF20DRAFT_846126 [Mycotypha africana]